MPTATIPPLDSLPSETGVLVIFAGQPETEFARPSRCEGARRTDEALRKTIYGYSNPAEIKAKKAESLCVAYRPRPRPIDGSSRDSVRPPKNDRAACSMPGPRPSSRFNRRQTPPAHHVFSSPTQSMSPTMTPFVAGDRSPPAKDSISYQSKNLAVARAERNSRFGRNSHRNPRLRAQKSVPRSASAHPPFGQNRRRS